MEQGHQPEAQPKAVAGNYPPISHLIPDVKDCPVEIPVDTAEDLTSILYEFVGHLAADVGYQGYEFHLVERAGTLARHLQAAIIYSVRRSDTGGGKGEMDRGEMDRAREARDRE